MVKIVSVQPNTLAQKAGLTTGDVLVSINGHAIRDVLDYRFYLTEQEVHLLLLRDKEELCICIHKGEYEDLGLDFETPLMDKKHSCANKCIFCFIDQLPKGMRDTLYFKDDDDRLSFLHGNYVTMTNLKDEDIDRLIAMHISPVNVSVHTTNPELRVRMMKNKRAGKVLAYLRRLADAGIALCAQIVLCKGWNDGAELDRTLHDLIGYFPALRSCSIVPVGLTCHRDGLEHLEAFSPQECAAVIAQVNAFGNWCQKEYGTRLFFCSDEFYICAGFPLPTDDFYEDYSQIENGVGMLTSLETEFCQELQWLSSEPSSEFLSAPRTVSLATGAAAAPLLSKLCRQLEERIPQLTIHVYRIVNRFFGPSVTVAGLLTGKDLSEQLCGQELGQELLIPAVTLKSGENVFLDDMTLEELSASLGVPITPCRNDGCELLHRLLGDEE